MDQGVYSGKETNRTRKLELSFTSVNIKHGSKLKYIFDWSPRSPVEQHAEELDDDQQHEGQDEHEAHGVDEDVLSGVLQVVVYLRHLDEDGRVQELEREGHDEPEGVDDEVDEANLKCYRGRNGFSIFIFVILLI